LILAEALTTEPTVASGEWNFGPATNDTYPVARLAETLARHWQVAVPWVRANVPTPREERELTLDSSKAMRLLAWRSRLPIEKAIDWVAEWYLGLQEQRDPRELSLMQISRFSDMDGTA
jgi:CDP-glucose 4,6-dehydratase